MSIFVMQRKIRVNQDIKLKGSLVTVAGARSRAGEQFRFMTRSPLSQQKCKCDIDDSRFMIGIVRGTGVGFEFVLDHF